MIKNADETLGTMKYDKAVDYLPRSWVHFEER